MSDKPRDVSHIVMSVPHSGTRTLQTWLSESRPGCIPPYKTEIGHWHFNLHPKYIKRFFRIASEEPGTRMAYIPVRNPFDVADSWERRYKDGPDKTHVQMCEAMQLMIDVFYAYPNYVEVFKIEDLPVLRGIGPNPEGWDKTDMINHSRVTGMKSWIKSDPQVEGFFRLYYNPQELWWL